MSNEAVNWAYKQTTGSVGAKSVLLLLADYADIESFSAYPGQERIARMTEQSVRSVRRHLETLEGLGLLRRAHRYRKDGVRTSDAYHLLMAPKALPDNLAGSDSAPTTGQSSEAHRPIVQTTPDTVSGYPLENHQEEPLAPPPAARAPRPRDLIWDAVVSVCGIVDASLTRSGKGAVAKAVAELKAVGATPDEIRAKAAQWPRTFPGAQLTAPALAKHWANLGRGSGQAVDIYAALR